MKPQVRFHHMGCRRLLPHVEAMISGRHDVMTAENFPVAVRRIALSSGPRTRLLDHP